MPTDFGVEPAGAEFSDCRTFRYALWRVWGTSSRRVAFIGLNPSTADETLDDPTIRRCIRFAKDWGFDGLYMLNAYAFRATDPKVMKRSVDSVGPLNDAKLAYYAGRCELVVACWGAHISDYRTNKVKAAINRRMECLGVTKDGHPKHPLYLSADTKPQLFWEPTHAD